MGKYTVEVGHGRKVRSETRPSAHFAEAWVDEFTDQGHSDIRITDPTGKRISVEELRQRSAAEQAASQSTVVQAEEKS